MKALTLSLLAAALGAGTVFANEANDPDADRDGLVTPQEHADNARRLFETMDGDRDGRVTASEMTAAHEKVTGKPAQPGDLTSAEKIAAIDTDKDGVLTAQEHADGSVSMFGKMDTDKDGKLTRTEIEAGHREMLRK